MDIGRLITAMVTPFHENGEVDYAQAKRLANALLDSGSDGVVVAGTTGEGPTLSHDEKLRLVSEIKQAVRDRGSVISCTGTYDTRETIYLTQESEKLGADAILLTSPYYNKPPQEGLYRHFEAIANSTSLPCILYSVQSRTAVNISVDTTVRLSQIPNIIGTKEASGDLLQIGSIAQRCGPDFKVWSGDDQLTLPIMSVGGYGAISVVSNLAGLQIRALIEAYVAGRTDEATALHHNLLPLIRVLMTTMTNPIPVKYALNQVGFRVGTPRLPLIDPDAETAEKINAELSKHRADLAIAV